MNNIYEYLHNIRTESGTSFATTVNYFLNADEESKKFGKDGHIPISNNICERVIKPFAITRRNVLFAKTENGASISERLFIIIQTTKANVFDVNKYLEYVININKAIYELVYEI